MPTDKKEWIVYTESVMDSDHMISYYKSEPQPGWTDSLKNASVYTESEAKHIVSLFSSHCDIKMDLHPRCRYG